MRTCLQHTVHGAKAHSKKLEPVLILRIIIRRVTNSFFILQKNLERKEGALTGSQRQRGMYMNAGSSDAGVDPDWDPVERKWKGAERREKEAQDRLEKRKQQENNK